MEQSGTHSPRTHTGSVGLNTAIVAILGVAVIALAYSVYAPKKSASFLTLSLSGNPEVVLTSKDGQQGLVAEKSDDDSLLVFEHADILSPYKIVTSFEPNAKSIEINVNREARDVYFIAKGFEQYKNFTITIDSHPLFSAGSFDWTGKFETPIVYYTKPGGFVFCYNAYKENKSDGITWCHKVPEGRHA
jgi:hypothetical protein